MQDKVQNLDQNQSHVTIVMGEVKLDQIRDFLQYNKPVLSAVDMEKTFQIHVRNAEEMEKLNQKKVYL